MSEVGTASSLSVAADLLGTRGRIAAWSIHDRLHAPLAVKAEDVPWHPEAITTSWLRQVLAANVPGAAIERIEIVGGDEGSSCRRRLRITWNDAGCAAGLPAAVFTKSAPGFAMRLSGGIAAAAEGRFLLEMAPSLPVEAPRCWYAKRDAASGRAMQVMEDLTVSRGAVFLHAPGVVPVALAERMLLMLAELHGAGLARPERIPAWLGTYEDFFRGAERAGIRGAHIEAMAAAEPVLPAALRGRAEALWNAAVSQLALHSTNQRTLIHSDVHPGNWYVTSTGAPGLCDWARVCRAHWGRDVAYALSTVLSVGDRRAAESDLLFAYAERLSVCSGRHIEVSTVRDAVRRQLCAALLMWTPTLRPPPMLPAMQPEAVSLEMIRRIAAAIDDYAAIDAGGF